MSNEFYAMIPWSLLKKHLEQQLRGIDSKLRRAVEPEASILRGRAQLLEELQNLPETLQLLVNQDEQDRQDASKNQ